MFHLDIPSTEPVLSLGGLHFGLFFFRRFAFLPKVNFKSEEVKGYEVGVAVRTGDVPVSQKPHARSRSRC